ncbi:MAG: response regulator transcription factor [Myxococcota bacterium]
MSARVLLIEDDRRLASMVAAYLGENGYDVDARENAVLGMELAARTPFDAIILDVMLPDLDGFEVCRRLRADSDVPILMLTARGEETDRIVGLELGADDYLPKPFNPRELLARLRAILRRQATPLRGLPVLRFGGLEIDRDARRVTLDGRTCDLTSHQFGLLRLLAESAGRTLSREVLMERLRGERLEAFDRSIDVHISRIRAAIEDDPKHPRRIVTVRGVGYLFTRDPEL